MPNVATVLKEEIARIAKKQAKALVAPVRKSAVHSRSAVADLKRRAARLERELARLQRMLRKTGAAQPGAEPEAGLRARITAKGMRSLRRRLALAGRDFARLLGVTGQAVYNWEKGSGALKLRSSTRAAILAIRGVGAREARNRLAEMSAATTRARRRRKTRRRK